MIAIFKHNLGMKILALVLAIAAWGFTRFMDPIEEWQMIFDVDVRVREGTSIVNRFPPVPNVTAYVTGPISRLERLRNSNLKVILDSRSIDPGETETVRPHLERRFAGVGVEFNPPTFTVSLDTTAREEFVPEETGEGTLQPGYFIDERIGLPTVVTVEGARTLVENVARVVYRLNYEELTGPEELHVEFSAIDTDGHDVANLTLVPPSAQLGLSIRPSQAIKTVPVVVDYQGMPATNYAMTSIASSPFMVDLSGPAENLAEVTNVVTSTINLTGKTASFESTVRLLQPSEGVSMSVSTVSVQVTIEQIDTSFTFEAIPIDLRGSDSAYRYELSVDRVNVTIRGGPTRIATITSDLVRPQVDVTGLGPGNYEIPVSVALPSEVRRDLIDPSIVTVTISIRSEGTEDTGPGNESSGNGSDTSEGQPE